MIRYMLDTNIVSFAMRSRPQAVLDRLAASRPDEVCISAVTLAELCFGAARSSASRRYGNLIDRFVDRVRSMPFDAAAATSYGRVRAALEASGSRIGDLDMLIAGHALSLQTTLVTNNRAEFDRVAGLGVEDWSVP